MSLIINIGSAYPSLPAVRVTPSAAQIAARRAALAFDGDTVELSMAGRALSLGLEESSFRIARVRAIRAEIQAGTYETPERINGTVDRLLDVLA